ncbi:MAG: AmmeMemoRadiSam system protein A [Bacillota bacterium]|jgi:AmmeMemoRadiSam system protein A|nr:AmmeMemoRadiSam system protein A [Bacillota bacterium]
MLVFAGLAPHPPIIVPEVGGPELEKVARTVKAMREWACAAAAARPETLVFISPHGSFLREALGYWGGRELSGDFASFGAPEVAFRVSNDLELGRVIAAEAGKAGVEVVELDRGLLRLNRANGLDHGIMVPLYYLREAGVDAALLAFGISLLPFEKLLQFGRALNKAVAGTPRRVGLIASGDLSHRLTPGAPAGYDPQGKVFDETIRDALAQLDRDRILNLPEELVERAGECGLRPIIMLLGALQDYEVESKIYSYEGPFGVGYLVADFRMKESRERRNESSYVELARASLEHYLRTGVLLPVPDPPPAGMKGRAGVFVSLKKRGQLRGCIGTIEPCQENVAAEIIHNAVSAGVQDPRFWPVELEELPELKISVDVLTPPEPVKSEEELDPRRYGVIVRSRGRTGLLLPALEGIETVAEQIGIARQKAGIRPGEPVQLERFEVIRHE